MSGYAIDGGTRQEIIPDENGEFKVNGNILYNSQDKDISLRIYLKWNDDENDGAEMDNSDDTSTPQEEESIAKVNVNLKFTQLPTNTPTNNQP